MDAAKEFIKGKKELAALAVKYEKELEEKEQALWDNAAKSYGHDSIKDLHDAGMAIVIDPIKGKIEYLTKEEAQERAAAEAPLRALLELLG